MAAQGSGWDTGRAFLSKQMVLSAHPSGKQSPSPNTVKGFKTQDTHPVVIIHRSAWRTRCFTMRKTPSKEFVSMVPQSPDTTCEAESSSRLKDNTHVHPTGGRPSNSQDPEMFTPNRRQVRKHHHPQPFLWTVTSFVSSTLFQADERVGVSHVQNRLRQDVHILRRKDRARGAECPCGCFGLHPGPAAAARPPSGPCWHRAHPSAFTSHSRSPSRLSHLFNVHDFLKSLIPD